MEENSFRYNRWGQLIKLRLVASLNNKILIRLEHFYKIVAKGYLMIVPFIAFRELIIVFALD
jgi:hypothetical protein